MPKFYDELGEASLENLASDPSNLPEGRVWKNSTSQLPKVAIGGAVKELITNDATQTLSNKTISGSANTITNVSGANVVNTPSGNLVATDVQAALNELQSDVDTRATSSALTTHTSATTSVHGITNTADLLTTTNAKVVTSKDIDGGTASNTSRFTIPKDTLANLQALTRKEGTIVYATDTDKFYSDNGINLVPVGAGSGVKNYFTDGDAEGVNPFTLFNDGVGVWVDGTGGATTATITQSSTTPLAGQKSFLFTSGTQYDTAKASVTIDREDKYKVIVLELAYEKVSGTYVDGDLQLFVYDSTNGRILYATPISNLLASGINSKQQFSFQATDSLTYEILIHQKTSATFSMRFEAKFSPQLHLGYAPVSTDPVTYVPTFTGFGTVTNSYIRYYEDGKYGYVKGMFQAGTVTATPAKIGLPTGWVIDQTDLGIGLNNSKVEGGGWSITGSASAGLSSSDRLGIMLYGADTEAVYFSNNSASSAWTPTNGTALVADNQYVTLDFSVPLAGRSSETKIVSEYDGRVAKFSGTKATSQALTANTTNITFDMVSDSHGHWSTDTFTAKVSGSYLVNTKMATSGGTNIYAYINGVQDRYIQNAYNTQILSGTAIVNLVVGDTLTIRSSSSITVSNSSEERSLDISLLSGAQQILTGQRIQARLSGDPASASAGNIIIFPTKDFDTSGAYNTSSGQFTVPSNGYLDVYGFAISAANGVQIQLYKNTAANIILGQVDSNGEGTFMGTLPVVSGDLIDIRPTGGTLDLQSGSLLYFKLY